MRHFFDPPDESGAQADDPPHSAGLKIVDPPPSHKKCIYGVEQLCWKTLQ